MARARLALLVPLALLLPAACSDDDGAEEGNGATAASGSEAESSSTTERPRTSTSTSISAASTTTTKSSTGGGQATTSTTTPAGPGIRLTGSRGSGTFVYDVFPERSELCYRLEIEGIGGGTAARIVRTASSSPVVTLLAPESGDEINTCVASDAVTLEEIVAAPGDFSIEVKGSDGSLAARLT